MKRILCYGDSNTWRYDPVTQDRLDRDKRWPGAVRNALGDGYETIEEGLGGRTRVGGDPIDGCKNGQNYLIPCLASHAPLDLVIIMLGTNDLKKRFSLSAFDIAAGAQVLVGVVQRSGAGIQGQAPAVLLLAPPPTTTLSSFDEMFEGAAEKSRKFAAHYGSVAQEMRCAFLDPGTIIVSSPLDGIHFEAAEHLKLGKAVAQTIKQMLGQNNIMSSATAFRHYFLHFRACFSGFRHCRHSRHIKTQVRSPGRCLLMLRTGTYRIFT